ncbi:apolipoprotein N-acyltransferase [Mangrovimonas sp. YM274]|uniref:apolipoprotein N-acyltransferase n=1 Tax=Mangrovimonas sp. YM274 TaxID=3070660 RepID=UPI0027DC2F74|nr:apolipoprotein N-acyltransferase [Mangrovimonas sp. YM274]WMI69867.1 apolipoprotein N-acyltransferase [Mangrovimonas sp. YM274]
MQKPILAISSGLLLALSWPTYGMPLLLFVAFIPLLVLEHQLRHSASKGKRLKLMGYAYIGFVIWNFITTNWLRFADVFGASFAILVNSLLMTFVILLYHTIAKRSSQNKALLFLVTLWICFEKLHLGWEFSWPWLNLGNAFSEHPTWIQWYEYTGTFGGTLWVWLGNIIGFKAYLAFKEKGRIALKKPLIGLGVLLLSPITISLVRYHTFSHEGTQVEVMALQPNIDPYSEKYHTSNDSIAQMLLRLTDQTITDNTTLILAPETVFADNVRLKQFPNARFKSFMEGYIKRHPQVNFLTGISFIDVFGNPKKVRSETNQLRDDLWYDDYNSAIMLNASDSVQFYNKSKLVVGIENFPYQEILKPLIGDVMIDLGGTVAMKTTQKERSVFTTSDGTTKAAPIICYESVYGEFVTGYVRNGANLLAIITNDAWWGETQGHKQHLSYARLRAIETRRPVVRSANTGISAIINAKGDIMETLAYNTQGALTGTITTNETQTFYTKAGDFIARISLFVMIGLFLITMFRRPRI